MATSKPPKPKSGFQHTGIGESSVNTYVKNDIGTRVVRYTLLSSGDLLAISTLNVFASLFFAIATFCFGNVFLSIYIQSLFSNPIADAEKIAELHMLIYGSKIASSIFFGLGIIAWIFQYLMIRNARIESKNPDEKKSFLGLLANLFVSKKN